MNEDSKIYKKYLKPHLTNSYFVQYGQLYDRTLHDIVFQTSLMKIDQMANQDKSMPDQSITASDNAHYAKSILQYRLAQACGVEDKNTDETRLLVDVLREALAKWGMDPRDIETNTKSYDQNISVREFRANFLNAHVIKSLSLPDDQIYKALAYEINLPGNRNKKSHKFDLIPEFFVLHLKRTDSLFNDSIRESYYDNVRSFVDSVESTPFDIDHPTDAQILQIAGENGVRVLKAIQTNCLFVAKALLQTEDSGQTKTLSLKEYSKRSDMKQIIFSPKNFIKAQKAIENATDPIDLTTTDPDFTYYHNCFKCSSVAKDDNIEGTFSSSDDEQKQACSPQKQLVDPRKSYFNVFRMIPLASEREARDHEHSVHMNMEPRKVASFGNHSLLIFCSFCPKDRIRHAAACCLEHLGN